MLSTYDPAAFAKGQVLKRAIRAAAALNDIYDDVALAERTGIARGTIGQWWRGAQMKPDNIRLVADVTGLSREEMTQFIYFDGPPPRLPSSGWAGLLAGEPPVEEPLDA